MAGSGVESGEVGASELVFEGELRKTFLVDGGEKGGLEGIERLVKTNARSGVSFIVTSANKDETKKESAVKKGTKIGIAMGIKLAISGDKMDTFSKNKIVDTLIAKSCG